MSATSTAEPEGVVSKVKVKKQIKTIVKDLETILGDLKDVAKELKEVGWSLSVSWDTIRFILYDRCRPFTWYPITKDVFVYVFDSLFFKNDSAGWLGLD